MKINWMMWALSGLVLTPVVHARVEVGGTANEQTVQDIPDTTQPLFASAGENEITVEEENGVFWIPPSDSDAQYALPPWAEALFRASEALDNPPTDGEKQK